MRKLTIVFFEAGGGHTNAAEALKNQLGQAELGGRFTDIWTILRTRLSKNSTSQIRAKKIPT